MIFQKDYILRLIQMLGEFVCRLNETLDEKMKERMLDKLCREECGLNIRAADLLDEESLSRMLPPKPRLMLSEIYYIRAMHTRLLPDEEQWCLDRSARLLLALETESLICQERKERLHELCQRVALTGEEQLAVFRFFLEGEAFDWAEDALFFALEEGAEGALAQGLAAFEGLRAIPEERLIRGGFSREELEALIHELQARI